METNFRPRKEETMKKYFVHTLAAFIILLGTVSLAQGIDPTEAEELRILKQDYRAFLIAQRHPPTEVEEMKLVKQDYLAFLMGQRQTANLAPTEAEEMRLIKQEYRAFLLEQRQNQQLARNE
jgi:DNA-binding CsgD family transcriptional regulator